MRPTCELIADAVATGSELTDAHRQHAGECEACRHLIGLPGRIAGATDRNGPRIGFETRATAGAIERLARRRRRRIGVYGSLAAAAGVVVLTVAWISRDQPATRTDRAGTQPANTIDELGATNIPPAQPGGLTDTELTELIGLSDVERSLSFAADWDDIEAPLASLRAAAGQGETQ